MPAARPSVWPVPRRAVPWVAACWLACAPLAGVSAEPPAAAGTALTPVREQQLIRLVRQDCGSCHGMRLLGGLGPPLTPQALADVPPDSVAATIYHGRPGTPMPPWRAMVSEAEAHWIALRLRSGFPPEPTSTRTATSPSP